MQPVWERLQHGLLLARPDLRELAVTWFIYTYFGLGIAFGLATATRRHLFSEGPARPPEARHATVMDGPTMWVLTSAFLWPVLALSGVYGAWFRRRRDR
jgi:hypothetical protein